MKPLHFQHEIDEAVTTGAINANPVRINSNKDRINIGDRFIKAIMDATSTVCRYRSFRVDYPIQRELVIVMEVNISFQDFQETLKRAPVSLLKEMFKAKHHIDEANTSIYFFSERNADFQLTLKVVSTSPHDFMNSDAHFNLMKEFYTYKVSKVVSVIAKPLNISYGPNEFILTMPESSGNPLILANLRRYFSGLSLLHALSGRPRGGSAQAAFISLFGYYENNSFNTPMLEALATMPYVNFDIFDDPELENMPSLSVGDHNSWLSTLAFIRNTVKTLQNPGYDYSAKQTPWVAYMAAAFPDLYVHIKGVLDYEATKERFNGIVRSHLVNKEELLAEVPKLEGKFESTLKYQDFITNATSSEVIDALQKLASEEETPETVVVDPPIRIIVDELAEAEKILSL